MFRLLVESLIHSFFTFRSHQWCKKYVQKEKDLKKETIKSPNDAWKGYLKTWND